MNISFNRGSRKTIRLKGNLKANDDIKFSIVNREDYNEVYLQKHFIVSEDCTSYDFVIESNDTRFGDNVKKKYAYEIELNNNKTIIGDNANKDNILILYREAGDK